MHTAKLTKLIEDIDHTDASKRRAAAENLVEGDERAVYPLIKALRDENFGVQDAAMHSLMEIKRESTAYMLLPLLREDAFLRNTALAIIKEIGKVAVPLLTILLKDKDGHVRKFALDLIYEIQYCNYPEKIVKLLMEDPNANVRAAAAKTLGILQHKEAVPQLINALRDEEWVCFSALEALTELNDERAVDSITSLLNNPSETIRYAAIETLGKISSPRSRKPMIEHLSKADVLEKKATIKSLIQTGTVPSVAGISDDLINMLNDGEWEEKIIAIKGLVLLKEKRAIYHMIDIAGSFDVSVPDNDEKVYIIKQAVQSFGCNDLLIDTLNNQSLRYRGKAIAIDIMGDLRCKEAIPILIKLLNDQYRDVKRSIIKSLAKMDDDKAKETLLNSINDPDSHIRKTAVTSLGKMGEMSAFEPLKNLLHKEKYNDVIDAFIKALLTINSTLFLSRINEFNENIQDIAERYASERGPAGG